MIYKIQYRYEGTEWEDFVPSTGHGRYYIKEGAVKQVLTKQRHDSKRIEEWGGQVPEWRVVASEEPEWSVLDF
jgi:hypothetical protein